MPDWYHAAFVRKPTDGMSMVEVIWSWNYLKYLKNWNRMNWWKKKHWIAISNWILFKQIQFMWMPTIARIPRSQIELFDMKNACNFVFEIIWNFIEKNDTIDFYHSNNVTHFMMIPVFFLFNTKTSFDLEKNSSLSKYPFKLKQMLIVSYAFHFINQRHLFYYFKRVRNTNQKQKQKKMSDKLMTL